ncbi:RlpA-like double-psi beta-barrel-protein domain-containing protein-containing protein [Mariannaea sp. PMI_226]|nr:RlpA-like double-psi beta-barrel-protein domain-containing protein-containing protein [Mariannaea sp. PMI_226]
MKFSLTTVLLAVPAVMGRACRARHAHVHGHHSSTRVASVTSEASATVLPISMPSPVLADGSTKGKTTIAKGPVPKTTLTTAIVVAPTKHSSSVAAASSAAPSKTVVKNPSSTGSSSTPLGTTTYSGTSTFYGGNLAGGNCGFTTYKLPASIFGTAYSGAVWNNAAMCGACVEVTGPSGTIKAMIVDQCPECDQGHLDLFPDAFTAAGGTDGIVKTSYKFVECGISSPLVLHNKDGTSQYWFSMQVVNHNEPVQSLEVSTDGGKTWQKTVRQDYNFFENSSGFGVQTMDVRVTSTTGKTVTVSNVGVASNAQFTATSNF